MNHSNNPARSYHAATINTASPEKVVLMLFDGALRFTKRAQVLMADSNNIGEVGVLLGKAQAILSELSTSLRSDVTKNEVAGKELVSRLSELYGYCINRILEANLCRDPKALDIVVQIINEIREGFDGAIKIVNPTLH